MIAPDETFEGTFPFAPHYTTAPGFRMHYVDEGPRDGAPIVLLHGEPTWGYLYRHLIPSLARHYRVIVPDHMGFGKSETPSERTYLLADHIANLEALVVDELNLHDITFGLHDWGGPIGGGVALHHPDRIRRLFLMNTLIPLGTAAEAEHLSRNTRESDWFRWAYQAQTDGTLEVILGHAGSTIAHLMLALQGVARPAVVTPTWIRAYATHFATTADCRGVIRFPQQLVAPATTDPPHSPDPASVATLRQKPAMLVYGMRDRALLPQHMIPVFQAGFPGRPIVELANAAHFCQEDAPETILALLHQFLQLTS
jgi:cis-3-alkyl-4-acyloxetan-2-one decarboxylase